MMTLLTFQYEPQVVSAPGEGTLDIVDMILTPERYTLGANGFVAVMCRPSVEEKAAKEIKDAVPLIRVRRKREEKWFAGQDKKFEKVQTKGRTGCEALLKHMMHLYNNYVKQTWMPETIKKFTDKEDDIISG